MKLTKTVIEIGLEHPLRFLHATDNHLTLADERDNERKNALASRRYQEFAEEGSNIVMKVLDEQLDYARRNCDLLLHTGDLIDFVSCKNFEIAKEKLDTVDYFMAVGNHEFSQYVGEAFEDEAYKQQSYDRVQAIVKNDLSFASRIIGGLNLVALDNVYYYFKSEHLAQLKAEVAKGLPILLLMHNPIYTPGLYHEMMTTRKNDCAYVCDCPLKSMESYPKDRYIQQRPTPETSEFVAYLKTQPLIKAVIAGHLHFNYEDTLWGNVKQYVTGGGYLGDTRYIEVR